MREEKGIKLMYVSLCGVDVITSISRLPVNVEAKRQKASLTLTNRRTHFKHTKTGLAAAYTHYSHAGLTQTHTPTHTDRPMTQ